MADQTVSDLIMKFVADDGPIAGEVSTELVLRDCAMTRGFKLHKMFEVQSFTLKTGLGPDTADEANEKSAKQNAKQTKTTNKNMAAIAAKLGVKVDTLMEAKSGAYKKFLEGDDNAQYPVDMKPMELTRAIDKSSIILLDHCINRKVFKSASLIKRKAAGGAASGEVFLRFDFTMVLIKSIDWDDGEPIKETCEFVCRAVTINYLPQLPDGTLGDPIQKAWSAKQGFTPSILG